MEKALTELCTYLNNFFPREKRDMKVTISGGSVTLPFLQDGQYFRIVGSVFNDGVHKYPSTTLHNEEFEGSIWSMAVPETVIDIASEIAEWQTKYGLVDSEAMSPFTSESFGNYSYSKGAASSESGNPNGWQTAFASRLVPYRRLRGLQ